MKYLIIRDPLGEAALTYVEAVDMKRVRREVDALFETHGSDTYDVYELKPVKRLHVKKSISEVDVP